MPPVNFPRATGTLRAFHNLSEPFATDVDLLAQRRNERAHRISRVDSPTWQEIEGRYLCLKHQDAKVVKRLLQELIQLANEFVGCESPSDVLEGAAAFLMQLFHDSHLVEHKHSVRLRQMFGPFPSTLASKAQAHVCRMVDMLPEDTNLFDGGCPEDDLMAEEFGSKIKFTPFRMLDELQLRVYFDEEDDDAADKDMDFSLQYKESFVAPRSAAAVKAEKVICYDRAWLEEELVRCSLDDVAESIINVLSSTRNNVEIQNELFDLLGFDRMNLIEILLEHRRDITSLPTSLRTSVRVPPCVVLSSEQVPSYGTQVTIQVQLMLPQILQCHSNVMQNALQSEHEKIYRKQIRKEDKKLQREMQLMDGGGGFDPQFLRQQREHQLIAAMQTPLFSNKNVGWVQPERYPNVYDCYADAKMTSGFISGAKIVLPSDAEKLSNSKYEEVSIAARKGHPSEVVKKSLILIESLDQIGQVGFRGMKSLNLIQSVVFDTAYHTNENLLVCAPTGAGKTNIAMLTILHQVKIHMEGGILRRDSFKIVYVAPMKALAAEMVRNIGKRLEPLGIVVKELTGDMQLTRSEISQTQILVTTPEKWDVVTRKSTGDVALTRLVKLIILDEVHLLHGDRGPVLEALVARTLRQVESTQSMIRIVGLSATLPNYIDVARFLRVNPYKGLFFFDGRFRPVPLSQTFVGVKATNSMMQMQDMDEVCYDKVSTMVDKKHQVMVFVHARNATVRTAQVLKDLAQTKGHLHIFNPQQSPQFGLAEKQMMRSRNKQLRDLFAFGFSIHHAGMLRSDRNMVEKYFADGLIKVLVCTSTLAWGVNLPAHAVIIRGTEIYDSKHGKFVDLGILDVMQIFGRAGRPQFDKSGHGTIITTHDKLSYYLSLMTSQFPIESSLQDHLTDNLNAEIALGTVTNVEDAVEWLSYTYLFERMKREPRIYGADINIVEDDPTLLEFRRKIILECAETLKSAQMIRVDPNNSFSTTEIGCIASHFYIKYDTMRHFRESINHSLDDAGIFYVISKAQEFEQLKIRSDEEFELQHLGNNAHLHVRGGVEETYGKVNILLQAYLSQRMVDSFSLVSDQGYIIQNGRRIVRALFEMALRQGKASLAIKMLEISLMLERRMWGFESPLKQFGDLGPDIYNKLKDKLNLDQLLELNSKDIGQMIHNNRVAPTIKERAHQFPRLNLDATVHPITRSILRIHVNIEPEYNWNDRLHGRGPETFWIWVEDPTGDSILHSESFLLTKKQVIQKDKQALVFTIPAVDPLPQVYTVRACSDRWLGATYTCELSMRQLKLPEEHPALTELLSLEPLPKTALKNSSYESLYSFSHFNPVQTQLFHTLYHTDHNMLLGAPTGSGKTIAAEVAMLRVFNIYPESKVVYIAPMKALVRERVTDWTIRFQDQLGKRVVELTGDTTPDARSIIAADIIVTTPEKWDGVSRSWQTRQFVQTVALIIIDEIHLLGEDRGPVLEVIVSRTNFISAHTDRKLRVIGLSTAIANARDLADWLAIKEIGLFNFNSTVRPVPLQIHISGFPGKHYCPRMALMNKPTYQAVKEHSPEKPVLVFVSSRRQTRLTALDLIAYLAAEDRPRQWLKVDDVEMDQLLHGIKDQNLRLTLAFGIGIHHAGLHEHDRRTVEELFVNQKIQMLIATATLAWGVNFPAHLVIVKGTEYYDGKTKRYVDFPVTDVLQMAGRAGRPQYDDEGVAVVLVQDTKKGYYKKFLYSPFPVESSLLVVLADHINAEVVAGTISSKQDCLDYMTWTYFFRRLLRNPGYYNLQEVDPISVNKYLSGLVDATMDTLVKSYCLTVEDDERNVAPTVLGRIASYYYLSHKTVHSFRENLGSNVSVEQLLQVLTGAEEYAELPVRHNEDGINEELAKKCPLEVQPKSFESPHAKAHLLFQAHFSQIHLPCSDYATDLKSVMDQAIRIIQAMIDVAADEGWLATALRTINLLQMVLQARWVHDNSLLILPHIEAHHLGLSLFQSLPQLMTAVRGKYDLLASVLRNDLQENHIEDIFRTLSRLPFINVSMALKGWWEGGQKEEIRPIYIEPKVGVVRDSQWIEVHADQEYGLKLDLQRLGQKCVSTKALAPKFPKQKEEGWFLVLGDMENKELIAMKRLGHIAGRTTQQLMFFTPEKAGRVIYTIYLMSDCYLGLDQQYDVCLEVVSPSIAAQVNTESIVT